MSKDIDWNKVYMAISDNSIHYSTKPVIGRIYNLIGNAQVDMIKLLDTETDNINVYSAKDFILVTNIKTAKLLYAKV